MAEAPLAGLRVVDTTDERGELCGRLLADLGAEVILAEPPSGAPSRSRAPRWNGESLSFAYRNANKRSVTAEPGDAGLDALLADADVWVNARSDDPAQALAAHPALIVVSVTPFGCTGPYRDFVDTDMVAFAMGGMMYRAGPPGKPPLVAPGAFAYDVAGTSAALATLIALRDRERTGLGQHVDVSVMEAVANLADWALPQYSLSGHVGSREGSGLIYPIFRCTDGFVRMVLPLAPSQWTALVGWLGEPEELMGEEWTGIVHRISHLAELQPYIEALFRERPMADAADEGQRRGLAVTPVLRPSEVVDNPHSRSRGTFVRGEVLPDVDADIASGFFELDGERLGFRERAPRLGEHDGEPWRTSSSSFLRPTGTSAVPHGRKNDSPLAGIRVLDFGIGAVGVEAGRLLAEYGADVIKVESRTYPDFIRTVAGTTMNPQFASSSRSKRSIGVNAKTSEGLAIVHRLVAAADVLIENSATGVMDRLGLGWDDLRRLNPRLVMVSSQLLGSRGQWAAWSGYGPNTRPVAGLTSLWNHPDDAEQPAGVSTVHPDHLVGRLVAVLALAALARRDRTGTGGHGEVAQFEAITGMLGDLLLQENLEPGSVVAVGNDNPDAAPWGPFPCAGDDEWCVVNVRDDDDWQRLGKAMGSPDWTAEVGYDAAPDRVARRRDLDRLLGEWTRSFEPAALMTLLQDAGVPAGVVQNPRHQAADPHLAARGFLRKVDQPPIGELILEGPAFHGSRFGEPIVTAAPDLGEHTREVCRDVLGMSDDEISALFASGVLEEPIS